eukprot:TRINITY_DN16933_c0_g1_i2.p1 TRINITY_DN16933_c0_g1~~TRINITY_DN16933_c0_g1_i2.p1  ORF type:complete len:392 (+),score=92.19 TRINITY_DN16933_c0_g1_i2:82-1257(+)
MLRYFFVFIVLTTVLDVTAILLTPANWDALVKDKTVFIKFFAPWCGHCKKIKPDWDRLMADFDGAPGALVAEVDCTSAGTDLCEQNGVKGFPTLKWGKANQLDVYTGARTYAEMKDFADDFVGTSCGPGALDYCEPEKRAMLEKFLAMSDDKLNAKIRKTEKAKDDAERLFMDVQWNMTLLIDKAETKKEKRIKAITEGGLVEAKTVDAWNRKHDRVGNTTEFELRAANVDDAAGTGILQEVLLEFASVQVTAMDALLALLVVAVVVLGLKLKGAGEDCGPRCRVRHILSKDDDAIRAAVTRLEGGESFAKVAEDCSICPSGKASGGSVGPFGPGSASPEFEKVCFDPATKIGELKGPIRTSHGFHLLMVEERKGVPEKEIEATVESRKDK